MIVSLYKITTDSEGESKITFSIPSSGLADVIMLNTYLLKRLDLEIKEAPPEDMEP